MEMNLKKRTAPFALSVLNSYSQVFFSDNLVFAILLLVITFFDPFSGLAGLAAVLISNGLAFSMGFNRFNIRSGFYGFNNLLVGLGLGIYYEPGVEFYLVLIFASALTFFVTLALEGIIGKYGLPYLSVPFLIGIWMVSLASREFTALSISERGIFMTNEMFSVGGYTFMEIYNRISHLNLHESIVIYFRSLGAIFFQYHLFAGIIVAIGLVIYSRIAFSLSLIGFFGAYLFYRFVGGNLYELSYTYIGFNFILTSIAVGGFFIIPSRYSYLWVVLLVPLISITITSTMAWLGLFQLSIYSLPFNFIVLLFLYALKFRERYVRTPELVIYQQFSPEKNLYSHLSFKTRFRDFRDVPLSLPFWGEWKVTQGHDGEHTHRENWSHAWDFEIFDESDQPFRETGRRREDYYCYDKPVVAPADGWVDAIADGIDDNRIGEVDLQHNWGNTIVIKHGEKLYSQISHLKKGSFRVKKGDFVKRGDILAHCGNSGRSPSPHLHFQIQETPDIGSKTLRYPLGFYILNNKKFELRSWEYPQEDQRVSNIRKVSSLDRAFKFVPGQVFRFRMENRINGQSRDVIWEVKTDLFNNSFIECRRAGCRAYFRSDGYMHVFTHFRGKKRSELYFFYLAAYKFIPGIYEGLEIRDIYPLNTVNNRFWMILQDFVAPFRIFIRPVFIMRHERAPDEISDESYSFVSEAIFKMGKRTLNRMEFKMVIESGAIKEINVQGEDHDMQLTKVNSDKGDEK